MKRVFVITTCVAALALGGCGGSNNQVNKSSMPTIKSPITAPAPTTVPAPAQPAANQTAAPATKPAANQTMTPPAN